jgi:hypothetical protein
LVLEEPIKKLVAGDHDGKPRPRDPGRLARGGLHAPYQQGIRFTSHCVAIVVSF